MVQVCAGACSMGLVAPIALYFFHGVLADPFDFLVYFVLIGASFTGQTYWRAIVLCWTLGISWNHGMHQDSNSKDMQRSDRYSGDLKMFNKFEGCVDIVGRLRHSSALTCGTLQDLQDLLDLLVPSGWTHHKTSN